jgi:threonine/homoserine/homoserine lactone efflux protein
MDVVFSLSHQLFGQRNFRAQKITSSCWHRVALFGSSNPEVVLTVLGTLSVFVEDSPELWEASILVIEIEIELRY